MKTLIYCKCGAKTTPRNWRAEGWIKVVLDYTDGNRWTFFICRKCRAPVPALDPLKT